jgi:formate dehydrogenase subunit gamma
VTGLMLRWPSAFSNDLRTGATFVHDWFTFGIWIAVLGHIYFAVRDPIALRGMTRGDVTPYWARTERPGWYREVVGASYRTRASASAGRSGR